MTTATVVAMNNFARRHTPESPYSHFSGTFDELCQMVESYLEQNIKDVTVLGDDEDGKVISVTLPGEGFFSASVQAKPGMELKATFESRDLIEYPYFSFRAVDAGEKAPAAEANIILYSHSKLAVKNEQSTDAAWEIVSINAKRTTDPEPPHPVTMMRNQKNYPGGTRTQYTPEQWADAVEYWIGGGPVAPHVMLDV